jgi:predicted enzyme related to lactoylglutathione lyase
VPVRALSAFASMLGGMTNIHHAIDYVELGVADAMAPTRAFYERAFGWEFNDYGPAYAGIRWTDGQGEVGGLNAERPPGRGGVLVLLYSDDLDASLEAVRAAGGEVVEGPYRFPGGRRFHFLDPSGNELGVWANA